METRIEKTIEKHNKGYNCAQAVACTYHDLAGVEEETIFKAAEALGLGMGGMEGACGAVAGACLLAGFKNSTANLESPDSKASSCKLSREIVEKFLAQNGTVICKELKGVSTGTVIRKCPDCIRDAARFAEEVLFADK